MLGRLRARLDSMQSLAEARMREAQGLMQNADERMKQAGQMMEMGAQFMLLAQELVEETLDGVRAKIQIEEGWTDLLLHGKGEIPIAVKLLLREEEDEEPSQT